MNLLARDVVSNAAFVDDRRASIGAGNQALKRLRGYIARGFSMPALSDVFHRWGVAARWLLSECGR